MNFNDKIECILPRLKKALRFEHQRSGKGQLISKCPFGVIVSTKIPRKNLTNSALESKKW